MASPTVLPAGRRVVTAVPASSANLGPGFDALGLALDWADEVSVETIPGGCEVHVTGEGARHIPRDGSHLVLATVTDTLRELGFRAPGLRLTAHNTIPHGRGLGSSSAALVTGLVAAWALAHPGAGLDRSWLLRRAARLEGHADNVAAAVLGGFVLTWMDTPSTPADGTPADGTPADDTHAVRGLVHPDLQAVAFVPQRFVATEAARAALPATVPHRDAARNAGRAALLVHAVGHDPALLPEATRDWLHQDYRRHLMPESVALLERLRERRIGAFVSGAGPTVLALVERARLDEVDALDGPGAAVTAGFTRHDLGIGRGARLVADAPTSDPRP